MTIRIKSLLRLDPLWVPVSSDEALRSSPGPEASEMSDVDVRDNPGVASLVIRGLVEVVAVPTDNGASDTISLARNPEATDDTATKTDKESTD